MLRVQKSQVTYTMACSSYILSNENPIVVSVSSATGRAYTMLHQTEWCYSGRDDTFNTAVPGGRLFPYFCTPMCHFGISNQVLRRKFDPSVHILEKVGKNCLKMYDSEDFRNFLRFKSAKHHQYTFRGETSISQYM